MSGDKIAKLVRMANQIGDYFAPFEAPASWQGAATHLKKFWTPKMIGEIVTHARSGGHDLNPTAKAAVESLEKVQAGNG